MADAKIVLSAVDQTKAAIESAKRNLAGLGDTAAALPARFGTLGAAITAAFTAASLKGVIDTLDHLDDLSEKTGIATTSLAGLRYAGEVTGTPIDSLAKGVRKLSMGMAEAAGGNKEAQATFKALGIQVTDANGKLRGQDDVLLDLADTFSRFEDGAGKSAWAQKVFGKTGEELIPILNQGAQGIRDLRTEAEALGITYGGEVAKQAAAFNDNLKRLELAAEAAKVQLAEVLLPSLVNFTNELIEGRKAFGGYLAAMVELGLKTNPFDSWSDNAKKASAEVNRLQAEIARLESGQRPVTENGGGAAFVGPSGSGRAAARLEAARQELASAKARQGYFDSLIRKSTEGEASRLEELFGGGKRAAPGLPTSPKTVDGAAENLIASLTTEYANLTGWMSKVDEVTRKMDISSEKFSATQRAQILSIADQIDAFKRKKEVLDAENKGLEAYAKLQEEAEAAYAENIKGLREGAQAQQFEVSLLGKAADEVARLRFERELGLRVARAEAQVLDDQNNGLIDQVEARRRLAAISRYGAESRTGADQIGAASRNAGLGVKGAINQYLSDAEKVGEGAKQATERTLRSMEDALADFATTGKLSVSNLVDTMISEFMRLNVIRPLMQSLFGEGGFGATALSSLFGGFRAEGGPVASGKAYIVGERGPELFVPNGAGRIVPNNALAGQPVTVIQNFTVGDVASVSLVRDAVAGSERRIASQISRSMRYGGALA